MLKPRSGKGAAVKRLKALKSPAHVSAVVLPKPLRPVLQDMMLQAPRLPPPFEALKALPERLSAIELHASLAPQIALRAVLQAENKEKAAAVEQNLLEAIDTGKEMFLAETAGGLESEDAIARATAQYTRRIADSFTKSFQPKLVEDRVEMSVQADSGLGLTGALVGLLLPAVQQARNEQPVKLATLVTRDGASHTVILVEVDDEHAVPWTKPDDWEMDADDPFAGLKQRNGVFQAAFADGSVHTFSASLAAEMWKAMLTWKGGEVVQFPDE